VFHMCVRRISAKKVLIFGSALILLMLIAGNVRGRLGQGPSAVVQSVSKEAIIEQLGVRILEPYKCSVNSFELISDGPPGGNYLLGTTFIHFIPYLVPSALSFWERPELIDTWYVKTYASDLAYIGGGLGFSPLVDAYFNFGIIGCFVFFLVFSFALNRLHILAMRTLPFSRLRLIDCLVATTLIMVNRISISGYIKNYLYLFVLGGFLLVSLCLINLRHPIPEGRSIERC
jgi:hypothetical protein